jgi:hypothetical protein
MASREYNYDSMCMCTTGLYFANAAVMLGSVFKGSPPWAAHAKQFALESGHGNVTFVACTADFQ